MKEIFNEDSASLKWSIDGDVIYGGAWPNYRHKFTEQASAESKLFDPDEELRYLSLDVMYKIAEYVLRKYNIEIE